MVKKKSSNPLQKIKAKYSKNAIIKRSTVVKKLKIVKKPHPDNAIAVDPASRQDHNGPQEANNGSNTPNVNETADSDVAIVDDRRQSTSAESSAYNVV